MMAAMSGNVEVARSLVAEHKANVQKGLRTNTVTGFDVGCTPLHVCMALSTTGHEDMLALHLNAGADINAQSKSGL